MLSNPLNTFLLLVTDFLYNILDFSSHSVSLVRFLATRSRTQLCRHIQGICVYGGVLVV